MDRSKYNIVFMGTPSFAKASLEALFEAGYNITLVVTKEDMPSGRGMKLKASDVKVYAESKGLKVYQPSKLKNNDEALNMIKEAMPHFIVTAAYGKILPKSILDIPLIAPVNVHGSLLPKYRGSAPVQWAIINGEEKTGITTMIMDEGMDTGDILLKEETEITENDNLETVFDRLENIGASLIVKTLDGLIDGSILRIKQNDSLSTVAPMISKEMTKIDFNKEPKEIFNFVRGLSPIPSAYMEDEEGNKIKVFKVKIGDSKETPNFEIGQVMYINKDCIGIKCNGGSIEILELQAPSSKRMTTAAYLLGNKTQIGKRFI